jgi:hypothetical protein
MVFTALGLFPSSKNHCLIRINTILYDLLNSLFVLDKQGYQGAGLTDTR